VKKLNLIILAFILIVAAAALFAACGDSDENTLGSGGTSFTLEITGKDGESVTYTIKTDEKILSDALMHKDVNIIPAGTLVNDFDTIKGVKADFTADSAYWAFYENGDFAADSAFNTEITAGAVYAFKYEVFEMGDWEDFE